MRKLESLARAGALAGAALVCSVGVGSASSLDDMLSQVLATTPGTAYTVSFELAHDSTNNENDFSAWFGSDELLSLVNAAEFPYTLYTFTATATSSSTTLQFNGREVPAWYDLDDVSVSPAGGGNLVANPGFDLDSPPGGTAPLDWTLVHAVVGSDFFVGPGPGFGAFSDPNSANFGAVGTVAPGVPEASTWAMMFVGFAGPGFAGFRARRTAVAAL
jgi:hypothetical protein